MPESKVKFTGWQAVVVLVVLIGVIIARLVTFGDKKNDSTLMRKLEVELVCDYFPNEATKLREAYDSGDADST